jgi:hypothetical protein
LESNQVLFGTQLRVVIFALLPMLFHRPASSPLRCAAYLAADQYNAWGNTTPREQGTRRVWAHYFDLGRTVMAGVVGTSPSSFVARRSRSRTEKHPKVAPRLKLGSKASGSMVVRCPGRQRTQPRGRCHGRPQGASSPFIALELLCL